MVLAHFKQPQDLSLAEEHLDGKEVRGNAPLSFVLVDWLSSLKQQGIY